MAKKRKLRRGVLDPALGLVYLALIVFMLAVCYHDVTTTIDLKSQIEENEQLRDEVLAEERDLETEKERLTNPDYIEYLARGKYLITKYGEQVFKFPSVDEIK